MKLYTDILIVFLILTTVAQIAIWLVFYGVFNRQFFKKSIRELQPTDKFEALTVVICARNEAQNLTENLPAILRQQYPKDFTVLVVDDDSDDDTAEVLARLSRDYPNLMYFKMGAKVSDGKKAVLTAGVEAAQTEWIVVTDADCKPVSDEWLVSMANGLASGGDMVLGHGPLKKEKGWLNAWSRSEVLFTALQYYSFLFWGLPYMGVGRNMAWKKSLFEKTGGFQSHATLMSGDDDLFVNEASASAKVVACLLPNSYMYSTAKNSWSSYMRQKRRHLTTGKFYRPIHKFLLGFAALSHSLHFFSCFCFFLQKLARFLYS